MIAKANLHELAAGMTTVGSAHGRTRNPYDPGRNPGGSSGGTSAGIAASFAAVGLGTDTVGSIRIAAAQTALFGLRPTQGLTSVEGIAPLCLSQDTAGPLARTVHDLALVLDVITDSLDPSPHFVRRLDPRALAGRRIGRLETLFGNEPEDREVAESGRAALQRFAKLGAEVIPVELTELPALLDTSYMLILGEFPGDLAAYLGRNPTSPVADLEELAATGRVHPEVAPLVAGALAAPWKQSDQYRQAIANRKQLRELVLAQMESARLDALAYPTIRRVAAPLGEEQLGSNAHLSANSGLPAISMPIGFTDSGLPVGLELLGPQRSDEQLVAMAYAWEQTQDLRRPPPTTPPIRAGVGQ